MLGCWAMQPSHALGKVGSTSRNCMEVPAVNLDSLEMLAFVWTSFRLESESKKDVPSMCELESPRSFGLHMSDKIRQASRDEHH